MLRQRDVFSDAATKRTILSLPIRCSSVGCVWTGELRNSENHQSNCDFYIVSCTNKNCDVTLQRRRLQDHVTNMCQWRIINCSYCGEPYPHCQMEYHVPQCNKCPVTCTKCDSSIPKEMVSTHIKEECPLTEIPCPYKHLGCEIMIERRRVDSHLQSDVKAHLHLACAKLDETESRWNDTQRDLVATKLNLTETTYKLQEATDLLQRKVYPWKIGGFRKKLRRAKTGKRDVVESDPFYTKAETESYGYQVKVCIHPNGISSGKNTHLSVSLMLLKGEYDAILPWPMNKKVKFILIDQQKHPDERVNVFEELLTNRCTEFARPETGEGSGFDTFISHRDLLNSKRFIVNDTLFLQVEINSP
ncbi:TNF receptor-associated factor 5-like isoform X2 [Stylophora pistillata]|uniref:TNF receptor-associated factor 5-like isoform X2 n=1 Tax=Stylophora pistillata TaxID=50429 RepID=UPI000C042551|nr:TNF receptor-associated factor 5-like isoform X2 [Stylophora pistillata]